MDTENDIQSILLSCISLCFAYSNFIWFILCSDCQWGDHCGQVERACKEQETGHGPTTIRTPFGLGVDEWAEGLEKYAKSYSAMDGADNYDIKK